MSKVNVDIIMSKVKLAIRVRPFSEREIKSEQDRVRVVNVIDDNYVTITNIKVSLSGAGDSRERVRRYYADYTFDSACSPNQPTYATQEKIFETVGREVLASISHGFSTCVLAYGQSATGKTHTMMGSEAQPGLIPRICRALAEDQSCDITISFLEIYNERVHDLLVGETTTPTCHSLPRRRGNARKDLRVREHPAKGPYVQNLRRVAVNNVEALLSLVGEGTRRRRTAATRRNSTSSRSHALLEIATSRATLHLADLAGSEKAAWEGCRGRQKEGANINKSLVALSNVISALVGGRGRFVPYRDSALTWLLKDSFTGGANTFIIATVSPSFTCYGESASTLRWAERARQLRTPKTICGVSLVPRAVLQAQYDQLISELTRSYIRYIPETGKLTFDHRHWELYSTKFNSVEKVKLTFADTEMDQTQQKANENLESITSSVASGSSDIVNKLGNTKITNAINEELDNFLCPSLERTSSGSNLKVIAPLRHKRRQYRSQEVLPPDDKLSASQLTIVSPSQSEIELNISKADKNKIPHVAILHENQRAEIIASVTERLYSKFKKKEEAAVSKIESVVDRKIVEPLSELRICTNARQRLMELSQKALRNKRRIGIPAYTQTRISVIRVKDQATDVQTDLGTYIVENKKVYSFCRDVGTETIPITPRCKEIAVGSKYDLFNLNETSTGTQTKNVHCKTCFVMTDNPIICNQYTQTQAIPPPRRKKCILDSTKNGSQDISPAAISAPVISINISQTYSLDSESHSSEESLENIPSIKPIITPTPDLLTNHNTSDTKVEEESNQELNISHEYVDDIHHKIDDAVNKSQVDRDEFSDQEEIQLPRISVDDSIPASNFDMRHMILGRNKDIYPYNIVLSPLKDKENTKRFVTFKDSDIDDGLNTTSESSWDWDDGVGSKSDPGLRTNKTETEWKNIETLGSIYSESSDYSNVETDSFIKRKGRTIPKDYFSKQYVSIYKNIQKPKDVNKCCKEHLSHNVNERFNNASCDSGNDTLRHQDLKMKCNTFLTKDHTNGDNFVKKINAYCNDLENSTKRYDNYLQNYRSKITKTNRQGFDKKPKEFLQELVQLRREAIKSSGDNTDSSYLVPGDST